MVTILLCILFCTYLVVCLKLFQRFGINGFQGIVFNYIAAFFTGVIVDGKFPLLQNSITHHWIGYALYLGTSFIFFFNVMELITRKIGPTVTSVSGKLSLVIPVLAGFFLLKEEFNILKVIGIILALVAVVFTASKEKSTPFSTQHLFWPLLLFFGSGINDMLVKFGQSKMPETDFNSFNMMIFGLAASIGIVILIFKIIFKKEKILLKNIVGGLLLGVPNYFSLIFLIRALAQPSFDSTFVFPLVNIGIVILTGICGLLLFKEKFTRLNLAGMILAVVSLLLIAVSA